MKLISTVLVLIVFTSLHAAPIPANKEIIDSKHLNDTCWKYHYGCNQNGKIYFNKDGTYFAYHHIDQDKYFGTWYVDRTGVVHIAEFCHNSEGNYGSPTKWRMTITKNQYPVFTGYMTSSCSEAATGTFLQLSNPQSITNEDW